MNEIIEELKRVSDLLYQENISSAYARLAKIIPEMSMAIGNVEDESTQTVLVEKLSMALNAMENGDALLLADIIQYELLEVLETL